MMSAKFYVLRSTFYGRITSGSGRRPYWPPPSCGCRPSSSRRRPAGSRRPAAPRRAFLSSFSRPGQRGPAVGPHFDGHLVGRSAYAPGLDLQRRLDVLDRFLERLHRIVLSLLGDPVQRPVEDPLGGGLLALTHHGVDELRDKLRVVERIRKDLSLGNDTASRHTSP